MVLFVLWPLGRAASVSPAVLLRSHLSEERERSAWPYAAGSVAAGLALFALAIAASEERAITASISAGIVARLHPAHRLRPAGAALRGEVPPRQAAVACAGARQHFGGPGSLARSIAVSLGLGLGLLVAVALIHRSLLTEIESNIEVDAPAYYFLDVEAADLDSLQGQGAGDRAGRQARRRADAARPHRGAERRSGREDRGRARCALGALRRPRPDLYRHRAARLRPSSRANGGPKDYAGPPLVSFDAELAKGLGLKLGDPITVNILGRNVEATIASLRKIDWESLAINFVMVFSPNTLRRRAAPHADHARIARKAPTRRAKARCIQALAERFPLVTAIKVGDIVEAAKELLGKVMTAISATAGVTSADRRRRAWPAPSPPARSGANIWR